MGLLEELLPTLQNEWSDFKWNRSYNVPKMPTVPEEVSRSLIQGLLKVLANRKGILKVTSGPYIRTFRNVTIAA